MPIHKIEVSEYECIHCGSKWINRTNGKDGLMPDKYAKCNQPHWNDYSEDYDPIGSEEKSLRVQLYKYEEIDSSVHTRMRVQSFENILLRKTSYLKINR
jgi:hypothetical protein